MEERRLAKPVLAVILAGGEGERLSILSSVRAKPAVPFGGKYRIIDFTLSNCVNSGIDNVVVLTQYNPRSLNDHIGLGRPWDLDRNTGGVRMLQPYIKRGRVAEWYGGTADAVLQNFNVVERAGDDVLILAGDHIYKMDYQPFIAAHRRKRADVTIAVRRVPLAEATRMGILAMDESERVVEWQEKPKLPKSDLASMGVYVFSKKSLRRWLSEDRVDFGRHVIPAMLDAGARVYGYRFQGYWQDVGTIQSYWEANLALLEDHPELDLYLLRPPIVLGPHAVGAKSFLPERLAQLGRRLGELVRSSPVPLPVIVPSLRLQFIHEDDVGQAFLKCIVAAGPPGAYNITGEGVLTGSDVARELGVAALAVPAGLTSAGARALTSLSQLPFLPPAVEWLEVATRPAILDASKAKRELDWQPRYTSLEALRDTIAAR